jgi:hypothetical protein
MFRSTSMNKMTLVEYIYIYIYILREESRQTCINYDLISFYTGKITVDDTKKDFK